MFLPGGIQTVISGISEMSFVFLIYGLAFFILGFSILLYPKKGSGFKLAKYLYLIAGFGILHGINEWLDLFIMIKEPIDPAILEILRMISLPASFLFFFQFASKTFMLKRENSGWLKFLTPVVFVIWLAVYLLSDRSKLMWDVWSRYLLCAPGSFLVGLGLLTQLSEFKKAGYQRAYVNLKISAIGFIVYAVLAGAIVPEAEIFPASVINYNNFIDVFGFPVQLLRAGCAVVLAYGIVCVLSVFEWESREAIRQSNMRFRAIADEASVIFFVADTNGIITFIDGKSLGDIGLEADKAIGESFEKLFDQTPDVVAHARIGLEGNHIVSVSSINGFVYETCFAPLIGRNGLVTGLTGVFVDITQRERSQAILAKYRKEMDASRRLATLGTMSDIMAQELSEPLAVTRVYLQRSLRDVSDPSTSEGAAKKISRGIEEIAKAKETIDRFYSSAQITPSPKAEPVDMYQMVHRIIAVFEESARNANIQVVTSGMDIAPSMRMSSKELEQIFFILIQNAIEAADGGNLNSLTINCSTRRDEVELEFVETCGGVPDEMLTKIFEPFMGGHTDAENRGLGLAIVKRIVTAYDGSIKAISGPDKGITFQVVIPIEQVY